MRAALAHDEVASETVGEDGSGLLSRDGHSMPVKFHPLANLFPLIDGAEFDALVADVKANGVRRPIVLFEGMVLDGRNRYLAAREAGVGYPVVDFTGHDAVSFVVSENLRRRHLTETQRSMVAAKLANLPRGGDRRTADQTANLQFEPANDPAPQVSRAQAAEMLNVSERSVNHARAVVDHGTPALVAAVEAGQVSVSAAAEVAKLPEAQQAEIVEDGPAAVRDAAKQMRETGVVNRTSFTGNNEWFTPVEWLDRARRCLGAFDLDPASNELAQADVKAERFFTEADDGLTKEWRGRVWLNPPYAQPAIGHFVEKLVTEVGAGNVTAAIMLTHNYTDTAWFQMAAKAAAAICFTKGRIRFVSPDGALASPTQGQALFYYGADVDAFAAAFGSAGLIVEVR